ncbi:RNA-directed DNA polymerase [Cohnella fermenti]|uniref:RNA-directed DNA polymerase n=1 Tax=Cohnella fermenti TaxID=2565925 RepID=UPI001454DFA5|nr:RNA-directed DNA polymerase [Cohnella fermenti]
MDPIDSLLLAAVIFEFGDLIEKRRRPVGEKTVFSYRFAPERDGIFYSNESSWKDFWESCLEKSRRKKYVVQMDISDFYNQIYHHTVENQLGESGFPNAIIKFVMRLLEDITKTVSRGIPIGPHSSHLIAEMTLIPIDDSLSIKGIDYCRYADDIYVFCDDEKEAQITVYHMAEILDKQQKLILQGQKTEIFKSKEFVKICKKMLNDNPLNENEDQMIKALRKYTTGSYKGIDFNQLDSEDQELFADYNITEILEKYLNVPEPDFKKIRWLYRRLGQIGAPGGIEYTIENINTLIPAISDVCHYLIAASRNFDGDFPELGDQVITILQDDLIQANEYFYIAILNLFASNSDLNHLKKLLSLYKYSSPEAKRKIIFAAYEAGASTWIRELKELFSTLDPWSRRAMLVACKILPEDERSHYLKHIKKTHSLSLSEELILEWSLNNKKYIMAHSNEQDDDTM